MEFGPPRRPARVREPAERRGRKSLTLHDLFAALGETGASDEEIVAFVADLVARGRIRRERAEGGGEDRRNPLPRSGSVEATSDSYNCPRRRSRERSRGLDLDGGGIRNSRRKSPRSITRACRASIPGPPPLTRDGVGTESAMSPSDASSRGSSPIDSQGEES